MMKRGEKRGQFYLVSAIILAVIIVSITVVTNYSKKQDYGDLDSLRDEIQIEAAKTLDYGISQGLSQAALNSLMQGFTQEYIGSESRDKDLYFLFGNANNVTVKGYQKAAHAVFLDSTQITSSSGQFAGSIDPAGSAINFKIDSDSYSFNLNSGENFYFLIAQETTGGKYVITG